MVKEAATLEIKNDREAEIIAAIRALESHYVVVGITEATNKRTDTDFGNAAIAEIAEHGSPLNNIPARPVLGPAMRDAKRQVAKAYKDAALAAMKGDKAATLLHLQAAGDAVVKKVQDRIRAGISPPPAAATLRARKARGIDSIIALLVTGQLIDSYVTEIRERDE